MIFPVNFQFHWLLPYTFLTEYLFLESGILDPCTVPSINLYLYPRYSSQLLQYKVLRKNIFTKTLYSTSKGCLYKPHKFPGSSKCVHDVGHYPGEEEGHHDPPELQDQQDDGDCLPDPHLGWLHHHCHATHCLLQYSRFQQRKEVKSCWICIFRNDKKT